MEIICLAAEGSSCSSGTIWQPLVLEQKIKKTSIDDLPSKNQALCELKHLVKTMISLFKFL